MRRSPALLSTLAVLFLLPISSCAPPGSTTPENADQPAPEPEAAPAVTKAPEAGAAESDEDPRDAAREVAEALRDRDFAALADRVGPEGVRFSPYSYVGPDEHVTLSAAEMRALGDGSEETLVWGTQDGSGEPIEMTAEHYFGRYVWDRPYLEDGTVAVDERQGSGSSRDNAADIYPDGRIVEYHVPGRNPDFGGMDWRSLRLVMERGDDGHWDVVGVIHDEWTI